MGDLRGSYLSDNWSALRELLPSASRPNVLRRASVRLDEVEAEQVSWLWQPRIPLGKVTVLDGDPGLGKSALTLDLAARITRASAMPDGLPGLPEPAGVLLLTAEDGLCDTVRPRLEAMGADLTRVRALKGVPGATADALSPIELPRDVSLVESEASACGAALIVFDPLSAHLGPEINPYRDQDVRRALLPLAQLAEQIEAAILVVRHLTKGVSSNPLYRGGGSIAFIGAARAGLLVARDPEDDDRRVLAATKSNLGPLAPSLAFRLVSSNGVVRIAWEGASPHSASALLIQPPPPEERSARAAARAFLLVTLRGGPVPAKAVLVAARDAGIDESTLRRAKRELGIGSPRRGFGPKSIVCWQLPADGTRHRSPAQVIDGHLPEMAIYAESDHLWPNAVNGKRHSTVSIEAVEDQGVPLWRLVDRHGHSVGEGLFDNRDAAVSFALEKGWAVSA